MDVVTVFGVKWRTANYLEILIIVLVIALVLFFFTLLRYYQRLKDEKINDYQLFLFKLKRSGLSNFQVRIINNIVEILRLSNPNALLDRPALFESAIGKFLEFLQEKGEQKDSLASIIKDMAITYEKLYHPANFKKQLTSIAEIENRQIIYLEDDNGNVFLGKIVSKSSEYIYVRLFRSARMIQALSGQGHVKVYIWRVGDAEYIFETETAGLENDTVNLRIPEEFIRDKEFRRPYLDVVIPSTMTRIPDDPLESEETMPSTLFKLNDKEAVIRTPEPLNYRNSYTLEFEIMDYKVKTVTRIIANKIIKENNIYYYTVKYEKMSDASRNVLKKYLYENL